MPAGTGNTHAFDKGVLFFCEFVLLHNFSPAFLGLFLTVMIRKAHFSSPAGSMIELMNVFFLCIHVLIRFF